MRHRKVFAKVVVALWRLFLFSCVVCVCVVFCKVQMDGRQEVVEGVTEDVLVVDVEAAVSEPVVLEVEPLSLGEFVLTAYCPCERCCGVWAKNRPTDFNGKSVVVGSSGQVLTQGVSVAVDPDVIPYGTELQIGGKMYVAHDCGGAIQGNRIDVYFEEHEAALEFGVQKDTVYKMEATR